MIIIVWLKDQTVLNLLFDKKIPMFLQIIC